MNRMQPHAYRLSAPTPPAPPLFMGSRSDLVFSVAPADTTALDLKTGMTMRVDGYWRTPSGRTLFIALSTPGAVLRQPADIA